MSAEELREEIRSRASAFRQAAEVSGAYNRVMSQEADFLDSIAERIRGMVTVWQTIETAPKDAVIDLLHKDGIRFCESWWDEIDGVWVPSGRETAEFTHWMPLPGSPND